VGVKKSYRPARKGDRVRGVRKIKCFMGQSRVKKVQEEIAGSRRKTDSHAKV